MAEPWIISVGNYELLAEAFNGVAMLVSDGGFLMLAKIGAILGLIFACISGLFSGTVNITKLLTVIIIHLALFSPTTTVHVEDVYTNQVKTIANVPVGVAWPAAITSNIGVYFAKKFEQAFQILKPVTANTTTLFDNGYGNGGYLNTLQAIMKLRDIDTGPARVGPTGVGEDWNWSFQNYFNDCVLYSLESDLPNKITYEKIHGSNDIWATLATDFVNLDTVINIGGTTKSMSCKDAYTTMTNSFGDGGGFYERWKKYLEGVFGTTDPEGFAGESAAMVSGQTLSDGAAYMKQALMRNMVHCAFKNECVMLTQAIEQKRVAMAAEQNFFQQYAKPMMAFVETFVIAITPFAAFIILFGGHGIAIKYLQTLAWVSMWPPMMAICNMFISFSASTSLPKLLPTGADPQSLSAMESTWTAAADWIAFGGMAAASVPALAGMLVFGTTAALTQMASRASQSNMDPKLAVPDLAQSAPLVKGSSQHDWSPQKGLLQNGTQTSKYEFGGSLSSGVESANSARVSATNSVAAKIGKTYNKVFGQDAGVDTASRKVSAWESSNNTVEATASKIASSVANSDKVAETEREAIKGSVSAYAAGSLGGNIPFTKIGLEAGIRGGLERVSGYDAAKVNERTKQIMESLETSKAVQSMEGTRSSVSKEDAKKFNSKYGISDQDSRDLSTTTQKAETADRGYQQKAAISDMFKKTESFDVGHLAFHSNTNPAFSGAMKQAREEGAQNSEFQGAYNRNLEKAMRELGHTQVTDTDRDAATAMTLFDMKGAEGKFKLAAALTGQNYSATLSPDANAYLKDKTPDSVAPGLTLGKPVSASDVGSGWKVDNAPALDPKMTVSEQGATSPAATTAPSGASPKATRKTKPGATPSGKPAVSPSGKPSSEAVPQIDPNKAATVLAHHQNGGSYVKGPDTANFKGNAYKGNRNAKLNPFPASPLEGSGDAVVTGIKGTANAISNDLDKVKDKITSMTGNGTTQPRQNSELVDKIPK